MTTIYFEDEAGAVLKIEPDCPCSLDGKLLRAKDVLMGEEVYVHLGCEGWIQGCRVTFPNKKLTFTLQVEVPHWAKTKEVYNEINASILQMIEQKREMFEFDSHQLSYNEPLEPIK